MNEVDFIFARSAWEVWAVTRKRKIFTAGLILGLGCALAWPFRKSSEGANPTLPRENQAETLRASNGDPIASAVVAPLSEVPMAPDQVVARMASTNEATETPRSDGLESFDLANHPALAQRENASAEPTTPTPLAASDPTTRPAYTVTQTPQQASPNAWPTELIHVVSNGDTLEKLAERYLRDSGRALEIFDLNRDQLSNPHLLPIGVELRVPADPDRIID
ncbi:MAG: LysM peptidoglycan-binding domain-containing protein [Bythopirellula sp.]|nr:LysM peptidoglycan-binding domain-containing protein [Bythopirellula sp.]